MPYHAQVVSDCYHEAAHAVFFHRAGIKISKLYVYGEGKIGVEWPTGTPPPEQALELAAGCLAGPLSSYKLHGQDIQISPFEDFLQATDSANAMARMMEEMGFATNVDDLRAVIPPEDGDDYEGALEMLKIAEGSCGGLEACYEATVEKVRQGLESWWPEIRAVAEQLMKSKRLGGSETVRLIESSGH